VKYNVCINGEAIEFDSDQVRRRLDQDPTDDAANCNDLMAALAALKDTERAMEEDSARRPDCGPGRSPQLQGE
jgi:hypothetical protein